MQWKCLKCGTTNLDYLDTCRVCGTGKDGSVKDAKQFEAWKNSIGEAESARLSSVPKDIPNISPKSRLVALLLCFFLGGLGVHRFYVGKIGTGILMLMTLGGFAIWWLIDLIIIIVGSFEDKDGRRVFRWTEPGSV